MVEGLWLKLHSAIQSLNKFSVIAILNGLSNVS